MSDYGYGSMERVLADFRRVLGLARELEDRIERLGGKVAVLDDPEWFTLRAACRRKGVAFQSTQNDQRLQPRGGVPDGLLHGKRVWSRRTVTDWCAVTDDRREEYLSACARDTTRDLAPLGGALEEPVRHGSSN